MSWETCSTCSDATCGSLYFYWRLEKFKEDGSNYPLYRQSQPPCVDPDRYLLIKSSGYFPAEQDNEAKMVNQHLVRQGYLDLEKGKIVICSQDDEPWGLTLYTAELVEQGAGGRISGKFLVMGSNYTPFQARNGRICGPDGQWFLAPSQGSVRKFRTLLDLVAQRKEAKKRTLVESKLKMLPSVTEMLKAARLSDYAEKFEDMKHTTESLIKAAKDHTSWKAITGAAGMKSGHAARFKRRVKDYCWVEDIN
eukprot:CAMPEP_0167760922 /NCGR_PEP_ID=MMETSP0110_2-20121227/11864_1 /TAXON_ID=629695 /ORGANISM="Gymnochlora sp., Strain CCMP2014" /LENGTH=250 /DNA_ID=CAMNT_0007647505 /DNA_START=123 /DNA_END=875 /DNA_ORIENTATION=-